MSDGARVPPFVGAVVVSRPDSLVYTVSEIAYLLDFSVEATVQDLREGVMPGVWVGGCWVVPRRQFHAWLNSLPYADEVESGGGVSWSVK